MVDPFDEAMYHLDEALERLRHIAAVVNRGIGGREIALVTTKVEEAKLWLAHTPRVKDIS